MFGYSLCMFLCSGGCFVWDWCYTAVLLKLWSTNQRHWHHLDRNPALSPIQDLLIYNFCIGGPGGCVPTRSRSNSHARENSRSPREGLFWKLRPSKLTLLGVTDKTELDSPKPYLVQWFYSPTSYCQLSGPLSKSWIEQKTASKCRVKMQVIRSCEDISLPGFGEWNHCHLLY